MNATVRRGVVVVLLVLSAACRDSVPTSPTGTSPSPTSLPGLTPVPSLTPAECDTSDKLSSLVWTFAHLHIRSCRLSGRRIHGKVALRPLR